MSKQSLKLHVIVGGQYGSEAKGHVAAQLAARADHPTVIRVAGPNAGHTVVNPHTGTRHALRQVPVGLVTNTAAYGGIAAGSEIDLGVLADEINMLEADGLRIRERLMIDAAATLLEPKHIAAEAEAGLTGRIGSTGKGIGAARAARIMRTALTVRQVDSFLLPHKVRVGNVAEVAGIRARDVHIEGTQGYLLGLHHHFYPQVTSSDCTALDFLAMARINPWAYPASALRIWVVFRPYPIRVAGNSGPLPNETTWEELGLPAEQTTVTKKTRRVGLWDGNAARQAIQANEGPAWWRGTTDSPIRLALTMADQIDPQLHGATQTQQLLDSKPYQEFLDRFKREVGRCPSIITTSDRTCIWLEQEDR